MSTSIKIKESINMRDVFHKYGFEVNRGGFIICPFHEEKTASLKAYAEGARWKCFGCGEGGDVISFVMKLFRLNFSQACVRIGNDFGITNSWEPQKLKSERIRFEKEQLQKKKELEAYRKEYMLHVNVHRILWQIRTEEAPKTINDPPSPEFVTALLSLDHIENWLEKHPWR